MCTRADPFRNLARIIHEGFYYNRRYVAATSLTAGGLVAQLVNILFQVCFPSVVGSALKPASPTPTRGPAPLWNPHEGGIPPSELPGGVLPRLAAPRARLAWRLSGFVTNPRE